MRARPDQELQSNRVDHFEKRETIEVGIPGADSSDSVLTHENGGMGIVQQIAGKIRQLLNNLFRYIGMTLARNENR